MLVTLLVLAYCSICSGNARRLHAMKQSESGFSAIGQTQLFAWLIARPVSPVARSPAAAFKPCGLAMPRLESRHNSMQSMPLMTDQGVPEAEPFQKELLELRRRVYGPEPSGTPMILSEYADTLCELGKEAQEEQLRKDIFQLSRRLAAALKELGLEAEAQRLNKQMIEFKARDRPAAGTLIDTVGDGIPDSIAIDTVGDGVGDTLIPLANNNLRRSVQRMVASTGFKVFSLGLTLAQLGTFFVHAHMSPAIFDTAEKLTCAALLGELGLQWWAEGFLPRFLFTPFVLLDVLNVLPVLTVMFPAFAAANPAFDALRYLRATRFLRLARFLGPETFGKVLNFVSGGSKEVSELTRVTARVVFTIFAIVMVPAGLIWEVEKTANPELETYLEALYFAITTLTTVGYGDITPVTRLGRFIVMTQMFSAVSVIPFEVSNLVAAFTDRKGSKDSKLECRRCGFAENVPDARFCRQCGASLGDALSNPGLAV